MLHKNMPIEQQVREVTKVKKAESGMVIDPVVVHPEERLQRALGLPQPRYAHLPVVTAADGGKLAKSRCSVAPDLSDPGRVLLQALVLLQQRPPAALTGLGPADVLEWAVLNWNPASLQRVRPVRPAHSCPDEYFQHLSNQFRIALRSTVVLR